MRCRPALPLPNLSCIVKATMMCANPTPLPYDTQPALPPPWQKRRLRACSHRVTRCNESGRHTLKNKPCGATTPPRTSKSFCPGFPLFLAALLETPRRKDSSCVYRLVSAYLRAFYKPATARTRCTSAAINRARACALEMSHRDHARGTGELRATAMGWNSGV